MALTTPAVEEGISIEALSDSTVIRLCSALIVSPTATRTSMTATSLKSPMSGTLTSTVLLIGLPVHSAMRRKSASNAPRYALKRAAAAPSMTRWS